MLSPPVLSGTILGGVAVSSTTTDITGPPTAVHQMPSVIAKPKLYVPQPNSLTTNGPAVSRGNFTLGLLPFSSFIVDNIELH